mgnify:CR=1 FL=1
MMVGMMAMTSKATPARYLAKISLKSEYENSIHHTSGSNVSGVIP